MTQKEAIACLDRIIKISRIHLYKPIQIAEILYRSRTVGDVDLDRLENYRNRSKKWRDVVTKYLTGSVSTSSQKYQDNIFDPNAVPPKAIKVLSEINTKHEGVVEKYIYSLFGEKQGKIFVLHDYITKSSTSSFQLKKFTDLFFSDAGLKRSIDKAYEIAVYSLFESLVKHLRLKACRELGITNVPISIVDADSEELKIKYALSDNDRAGYYLEEDLIELVQGADFDLDDYRIDLGPLTKISDLFPDEEIEEDEISPVPEGDPESKLGEVYQLGRHRLMCGDATKIEDVEKLMGEQRADLFLTDPPYNVAYSGKTKDALTIQNDKQDDSNFRQFLVDSFTSAKMFMKSGAAFYIWHADLEGYNFRGACVDVGWKVRQCLIWNKNSMVVGRQDYQSKHEPCLYGWNNGTHQWTSDRTQTTVINHDRPSRSENHPTMKPVGLMAYQLKKVTIP